MTKSTGGFIDPTFGQNILSGTFSLAELANNNYKDIQLLLNGVRFEAGFGIHGSLYQLTLRQIHASHLSAFIIISSF